MKKGTSGFLVVLMLLSVFGGLVFAGGAAEAPTETELRVSWWGATGRDEKYLAIIEEYGKLNPDISITPEYAGWADYWGKMATLVAAKNLPDVHQYTNNQLGEYFAKGAVVSLEPYVKSGVIDLKDWNQGMVDSGRIKGDLVAITIGITAPTMIVNMSWAEELGIDMFAFDESMSWKEFAAWLKKDVQPKMPAGTYAFGDYSKDENYWWTWVRQNGAEWIDGEGNYAVPVEVIEEYYAYMDDLRKAGVAPPLSFTVEDNAKARGDNAFNSRKMLIRPTNANQAKLEQQFMKVKSDEVEMRRLPHRDGATTSAEALITSALTIASNSRFKDQAAEYINYFVNDTAAQKIYKGEIGVPGNIKVQDMLKPDLNKVAAQEIDYINMISTGAPPTEPKPAGIWAFDAEIQQMHQLVASGQMTPRQAAEATIDRANKFLSSFK